MPSCGFSGAAMTDAELGAELFILTVLRYDARLVYLDGRVARSKALHREANRLARVLHA
jgi:hypothetical protein